MAYLGNQPALSYTSFAKQDFTTSATTSYTLDNPVANENEIALFINFVRQEPTTAYTASGTSLTLTSATTSSDDMYCVYLGKAVQTVNPPNGSVGISQLSATGTKDATTFLRGDNTFASAGGVNTPAFAVTGASNSISGSTLTKVQNGTEYFDTDNCYDNSTNYRFTPTTAGKYNLTARINYVSFSNMQQLFVHIYKNGSSLFVSEKTFSNIDPIQSPHSLEISGIAEANGTSDYFEVFIYAQNSGSMGSTSGENYFGAYKIIE